MTHHFARLPRFVPAALTITLIAAPAFASGASSGSSSGSAASAPRPPVSAVASFNGTAYLKTSNTVLYDGKTYGLARLAVQGLIDQCNEFRKGAYGLPPVSPPESVLAALDVLVHEKYFDTNKALTVITGSGLDLVDMRRWLSDLKATMSLGKPPSVPPNCAQFKLGEIRNGTLWRDGLVYQLRYNTHKALARQASRAPAPPRLAVAFEDAPKSTHLGQSCREVVAPDDLSPAMSPESRPCIWDLFPYISYLNWPFVLSGRVQYGPMRGMFETIVPIAVDHGQSIPASVFEIPAGFSVIGP